MITTVMNAFKAFDLIYMFGPKQMAGATGPLVDAIRTMVYGVYIRGFTLFEMGYAAAESFVLFIMILFVAVPLVLADLMLHRVKKDGRD